MGMIRLHVQSDHCFAKVLGNLDTIQSIQLLITNTIKMTEVTNLGQNCWVIVMSNLCMHNTVPQSMSYIGLMIILRTHSSDDRTSTFCSVSRLFPRAYQLLRHGQVTAVVSYLEDTGAYEDYTEQEKLGKDGRHLELTENFVPPSQPSCIIMAASARRMTMVGSCQG
jgi:hypothetical protein